MTSQPENPLSYDWQPEITPTGATAGRRDGKLTGLMTDDGSGAGIERLATDVIEYFVVRRRGRNRGIHAAFGRWPWNVIKSRGWGDAVARRDMTDEEVVNHRQRMRHYSLRYHSIAELLEDERRVLLPGHADCYAVLKCRLEASPAIQLLEQDQ